MDLPIDDKEIATIVNTMDLGGDISLHQELQLKYRGYIVIDNFFTDKMAKYLFDTALSEKYVNYDYPNGYKSSDFDKKNSSRSVDGARMNSVFINHIRKKLPFLKEKKYDRSWSFVYNTVSDGVPIHADDPLKITVTVWVTPDECIFDTTKNGLIIFKKYAKLNWEMKSYNNGEDVVINDYVEGSEYVRIPYKFNRAIIFPGKTFHKTDSVHTKPGRNNRRVNYTFLFDN